MPTTRISAGLEMNYLVDNYTDPWRNAETALLLHGNAESSKVWFGWIPHLARFFRVVRPDIRGFGDSTPMPADFPWSLEVLTDDLVSLMRTLGVERVHLIAAKLGGTVARHFAARCPERVSTLTLIGAPPPRRDAPGAFAQRSDEFAQGVEPWARRTMAGRLGSKFPADGMEWWIKLMGRTAVTTQVGFAPALTKLDTSPDLPRISCPTLVITAKDSPHGTVEETRAWQQKIPGSTLLVLPGDSFHLAASDPDVCAHETLAFISRVGGAPV